MRKVTPVSPGDGVLVTAPAPVATAIFVSGEK